MGRSSERASAPRAMTRDLRETRLFQQALDLFCTLHRPGSQLISEAAELATNGALAAFTGTVHEAPDKPASTRVCITDLATGDTRFATFGPNQDRLPKFSPDGQIIAFLSDRHCAGDFQLYLLNPRTGAAHGTPRVDGWVENFHWSPNGQRILLGVAPHGADVTSAQGAIRTASVVPGRAKLPIADSPSWMPTVDTGDTANLWRTAWIYDLSSHQVRKSSPGNINVWECAWLGTAAVAAVVSDKPEESSWYSARLIAFDTDRPEVRELYRPTDQIGMLSAAPSGCYLAVVDAFCSDRGLVAGDLRIIDVGWGTSNHVNAVGADITYAEWRSDRTILIAGHSGLDTTVGSYDRESGIYSELWRSDELTTAGTYASVAGLADGPDCIVIGESFFRPPELAQIRAGRYIVVKSFANAAVAGAAIAPAAVASAGVAPAGVEPAAVSPAGVAQANLAPAAAHPAAKPRMRQIHWTAADGLEIEGWLLQPPTNPPYPLVLNIHGGPVWHWRPSWLGHRNLSILLMLEHGYAVFLPNPRGSSGRGLDFARRVKGDVNGEDARDCLSGLDYLIAQGIADPARLAVTGHSYGGNMAAWLITQDSRFAAAIPVCPHTNQTSQHLLSNIPAFTKLFLAGTYQNPDGAYFKRSPVMHAWKAKTPTLSICGALDRCTPSEEAQQFHNALRENGVHSVLVTYPEEGHGIRRNPASIDYAARVVEWLDRYLGRPLSETK